MNKFEVKYFVILIILLVGCNKKETIIRNDIKSIGEVSNNKRVGYWIFENLEGKKIAEGFFENDFQVGQWKYSKKLYNGTNNIDWNIIKDSLYTFNLPKDWKILKKQKKWEDFEEILTIMQYNGDFIISSNIGVYKDAGGKSLKEIRSQISRSNETVYKNYKNHFTREFELDGLPVMESQETLTLDNGLKMYMEWYIYKRGNEAFYISFFCEMENAELCHGTFSEIGQSLVFD
ncbi:hypothetical protein UJ101_01909 [Flavobacteriaceae bacterium UJ101]|nr:hypothetical protein UJ101_01909 [Flavobacteriaceae bacterium UJ101]